MDHRENPVIERIKQDVTAYFVPGLIAGTYFVVMSIAFGTCCPSALLFGLPCPGCGITRSALLVFSFDFAGAFRMNPLIYGLLPLCAAFGWKRYIKGEDTHKLKKWIYVLFVTGILFYIYRMAALYPDTEPMVYRDEAVLPSLIQWVKRRL